jgi:hypothetical protein
VMHGPHFPAGRVGGRESSRKPSVALMVR